MKAAIKFRDLYLKGVKIIKEEDQSGTAAKIARCNEVFFRIQENKSIGEREELKLLLIAKA